MLLHISLRLSSFLHSFSLVLSSLLATDPSSSLFILPSAFSYLLVRPCSGLLLYVTLQHKNVHLGFFKNTLLIFSIYHCHHTFIIISVIMVVFGSLNVFIMATSKSLLDPPSGPSHGHPVPSVWVILFCRSACLITGGGKRWTFCITASLGIDEPSVTERGFLLSSYLPSG